MVSGKDHNRLWPNGLVFGGDRKEFIALDASTGGELGVSGPGPNRSSSVTSEVAECLYVTVAAGHSILALTLRNRTREKPTRSELAHV